MHGHHIFASMSSRSALKQVHFAGLSWKEEEERSQRGVSHRRLRKIVKIRNRAVVSSKEEGWKRDEKDQEEYDESQLKRAFDMLKEPKVANHILYICIENTTAWSFLRGFLKGIDLPATTLSKMLGRFREDERSLETIVADECAKNILFSFCRTKAFRAFFLNPPGVELSATDTEEEHNYRLAFLKELEDDGKKQELEKLPGILRDYYSTSKVAEDSQATAPGGGGIFPSKSKDSEPTVDPPATSSSEKEDVKEAAEVGTQVATVSARPPDGDSSGNEATEKDAKPAARGKRKVATTGESTNSAKKRKMTRLLFLHGMFCPPSIYINSNGRVLFQKLADAGIEVVTVESPRPHSGPVFPALFQLFPELKEREAELPEWYNAHTHDDDGTKSSRRARRRHLALSPNVSFGTTTL